MIAHYIEKFEYIVLYASGAMEIEFAEFYFPFYLIDFSRRVSDYIIILICRRIIYSSTDYSSLYYAL